MRDLSFSGQMLKGFNWRDNAFSFGHSPTKSAATADQSWTFSITTLIILWNLLNSRAIDKSAEIINNNRVHIFSAS
jgi:hypothetical protein